MKIAGLFILTILVVSSSFLYFLEIKPRQVKGDCWKQAYVESPRVNEDSFKWASGKQWLPKPGTGVTSAEYVWIYPDQDDSTSVGEETREKKVAQQQGQYISCIKGAGY